MPEPYLILDPSLDARIAPGTCALGVMAKAPKAGSVKTRLIPPLTPEEAARLNISFLRDTTENISRAKGGVKTQGVAIYTPVGAEAAFAGLLPADFCMIAQHDGDFGARLYHAASDLLRVGFASVCLIDSDSPTLPNSLLVEAADRLASAGDRVVLGEANDGGYYLIGVKCAHRELFTGIDWSTERVLSQTIVRAKSIALPVELLAAWYDVDDAPSLRRLHAELFPSAPPQNAPHGLAPYPAPYTRQYLATLLERGPLRGTLAHS